MRAMAEKENQNSRDKTPPCQVTYFVDDVEQHGTSVHFHESGMLIMCRKPVPLNRKLKLLLQFPGFNNPIEVQAEVVWTNIHGPADTVCPRGMGVKFINLDDDMQRLLEGQSANYAAYGNTYTCYYT